MVFFRISGQCPGTETFEKVSGVTLRGANEKRLFSSVGNTVTAECNNRLATSPLHFSFYIWQKFKPKKLESISQLKNNNFQLLLKKTPERERKQFLLPWHAVVSNRKIRRESADSKTVKKWDA